MPSRPAEGFLRFSKHVEAMFRSDSQVRLTSDLKIRTPSPSFLHLLMCSLAPFLSAFLGLFRGNFGSNSAAPLGSSRAHLKPTEVGRHALPALRRCQRPPALRRLPLGVLQVDAPRRAHLSFRSLQRAAISRSLHLDMKDRTLGDPKRSYEDHLSYISITIYTCCI